MKTLALTPELYFSYSQFMVYDESEQLPGCDWSNEHTSQGFARRESTVCFGTLLEFGYAKVTAFFGDLQTPDKYDRVIIVPFHCTSGKVIVEGPEEMGGERTFELTAGEYKLTSAQSMISDSEEIIDLFFERLSNALMQSSIVIADAMLSPPETLIESSGVAGA